MEEAAGWERAPVERNRRSTTGPRSAIARPVPQPSGIPARAGWWAISGPVETNLMFRSLLRAFIGVADRFTSVNVTS